MEPTIARMVHYTLSEIDSKLITGRRVDSGFTTCNPANAGDTYPAVIVRTFGGTAVNLRVLLDGEDTYWACSRMLAATVGVPGTWAWPRTVNPANG